MTVSALVIAAPFGVTGVGLKLHIASEGNPLQAKVTGELNPFSGVTVNVAIPLFPATMVRAEGFTDTWKSGVGALMVYVAVPTALLEKPVAVAIAWIVSVELTGIAVVNFADIVVGVDPSVVKKIVAPAVASEMVTICGEV